MAPMDRRQQFARLAPACVAVVALAAAGCTNRNNEQPLNKADDDANVAALPPPPENGPKLGAIANIAPILERPSRNAKTIGSLHAGALVVRSATSVRKTRDCDAGYYSIFPRGVVCGSPAVTTELDHPTLAAMAIQPALDQSLPYTYGRTRAETALYERDPGKERGVREVQKLPRGSGMAIVGSWTASVGDGQAERLGLLTNGRFVRASELEALRGSSFAGYELGEGHELPVAFVVKRGVSQFKPDGDHFIKASALDYHTTIALSGRFRTLNGVKLWTDSEEKRWVRDQDVTVIHRRSKFPDFVQDGQRWLDVSVLLGTLVAYEGKKPVFATLASAGRDRLGDPAATGEAPPAITKLGTFDVVAKHVTLLGAPPERAGERYSLYDVPWVLELASGQLIAGAYWHDRFGIEHGPGDITLAPEDAHRLFQWATPALPKAWHSVTAGDGGEKTVVYVRK
jgi:hypothetical protein